MGVGQEWGGGGVQDATILYGWCSSFPVWSYGATKYAQTQIHLNVYIYIHTYMYS